MADTFSALEVWQKLRAHQQSQSRNIDHGITDLIDLLDWIHKEWRHSVNDNARLSNLNERLNRQIGNFELELDQARANNGALVSQLASANTKIGSLEEELLQYKERFKIARAEIQNAAFTFPMDTPNDARHGKRRSNSLGFMPGKRSKHLDDLGRVREDDEDENDPAPLQRPLMRTLNRSISDSHIMAEEKLQIHENCRNNSPLPCVPMIPTPQRSNPKQRPRLADLCPDSQPQIPGQIIRCVFALEKNYINNVGLYRVPGCDSEVKKLKETFNSKYAPKLEQLDPETITGFIKKFLRDLREPIIPLSSFKEFYAAMPLENLAKVLGPTVVGTASKLTHLQQQAGGTDCHSHHYMEASKQVEILYALLTLDNNYWTAFYNWQPDNPIMLQNNQGYLGSMTPHGATIKRRPPINQRYGESVNEPHRQMY
uniref:Rho-GAP domain-containing protein n=4 Tax=Meloidogyne TaxID=189290 RepID=A0A915N252_MELJA